MTYAALPGALLMLLLAVAEGAHAHEVRPAYLQLSATADHGYEVLWKRPSMGETAVHLVPHLSGGALEAPPAAIEIHSGYALERWHISPADARSLDGQTVSIEGLPETITDALVIIERTDGSRTQLILTPIHPAQPLRIGDAAPAALSAFVALGLEHVLTGLDHLAFLLGLLLLIGDRWMLVKTVTAFTVAHSCTLALATLGVIHAPVSFVNAAIALSIMFVGAEVVRQGRGATSLTIRKPWVVAFAFGLLHGFGFSSGLATLGLSARELPPALLLFNLGVELGQLGCVALGLWLAHAARVLAIRWPRPLQLAPAYLVGSLGALWTLQRVTVLLAGQP